MPKDYSWLTGYGGAPPSVETLIQRAATAVGATAEEVVSKRRFRHLVMGRRLVYWSLRTRQGWSFPRMARVFDTDHHTAMYNFYTLDMAMQADPLLAEWVEGVME